MNKQLRKLLTVMVAPVALLTGVAVPAAPAQAQSIGKMFGDHMKRSLNNSLREAERERVQRQREEAQRRADIRAEQRRMMDRERQMRNALPNSECRVQSTQNSSGRYSSGNETIRCQQQFTTNQYGQPQAYGQNGYDRYAGPQHYARQPVTRSQWNMMFNECTRDLRREYGSRATNRQIQNACDAGLSQYYYRR